MATTVLFLALVLHMAVGQLDFLNNDFECPLSDGYFADPANCRKFYQCDRDYPYHRACPSSLRWHDIKKECTFRREAVCGPVETTPAPITTEDPLKALKCQPKNCEFPYCFCSKDGTRVPGGLNKEQTPQMIILTFDGAINQQNIHHYRRIFRDTRLNSNDCPIRGTFFVSHEYSDYQMVQDTYHKGHEIGTYTITRREDLENTGYDSWRDEMIGMREILENFANVSKLDVLGMRAPRLKPGNNDQFEVLTDFGYVYDSSIVIPPTRVPIWPYTLDYAIPHQCRAGTCPTRSFPGIWEIPLNSHFKDQVDYEGGHCPYLDQCALYRYEADEVLEWLQDDFYRHYRQNRAPYLMSFHTNWFNEKELVDGLLLFLDWSRRQQDVWFVTITQALLWITDPKPVGAELNNFEPWDCRKRQFVPDPACQLPERCQLSFQPPKDVPGSNWIPGTRYMTTCFSCPNIYPWLYDALGSGEGGRDTYTI